jgi:hypothetical protein
MAPDLPMDKAELIHIQRDESSIQPEDSDRDEEQIRGKENAFLAGLRKLTAKNLEKRKAESEQERQDGEQSISRTAAVDKDPPQDSRRSSFLESRQEISQVQRTTGEGYNESNGSKERKQDNEITSKTKPSKTIHHENTLPSDKRETLRPRMDKDVDNKLNNRYNTPSESGQRKQIKPSIKYFFFVNRE